MSHPPRRLISTARMAWALALVIALALPSTASAAVPAEIPAIDFVRNPSYSCV